MKAIRGWARVFQNLPYKIVGDIQPCLVFRDGKLRKAFKGTKLTGQEFSRRWSNNGNRKPYKLLNLVKFLKGTRYEYQHRYRHKEIM